MPRQSDDAEIVEMRDRRNPALFAVLKEEVIEKRLLSQLVPSEIQPHSELYDARSVDGSRDLTECGIIRIDIWRAKNMPVEGIQELGLQLKCGAFIKREIAQNAEIFVIEVRSSGIAVVARVIAEEVCTAPSLLDRRSTTGRD